MWVNRLLVLLALLTAALPAQAAPCGGDFAHWLGTFRAEAMAAGISSQTLQIALTGVTPDPKVLALDRGQQVFQQSFAQFSGRMINTYRLKQGHLQMLSRASMLSRIEAQYGVPGAVLVAIWGLETDFGANSGKFPVIRSLVTLAHDCRRSDKFSAELMDALRIVQRGDLTPAQMRGAWAGELGQTQFLPSSYIKYAVDFDGGGAGKRDLVHSIPDVLASTANYLHGAGWQAGAPWGEGTHNFTVLLAWNKSEVYSKTVATFAQRLAAE